MLQEIVSVETTMETKDYNVMVDERNFFDQTVKNNLRTYDKIRKIQQVEVMITQPDVS